EIASVVIVGHLGGAHNAVSVQAAFQPYGGLIVRLDGSFNAPVLVGSVEVVAVEFAGQFDTLKRELEEVVFVVVEEFQIGKPGSGGRCRLGERRRTQAEKTQADQSRSVSHSRSDDHHREKFLWRAVRRGTQHRGKPLFFYSTAASEIDNL